MLNWTDLMGLIMILAGPFSGFLAAREHHAGIVALTLFTIAGFILALVVGAVSSKVAYAVLRMRIGFFVYMLVPMVFLFAVILLPALLTEMVYGGHALKTVTYYSERDPLYEPMERHCPPDEFERRVEAFQSTATLSLSEIRDLDLLAGELKQPTNAVLAYLRNACSDRTIRTLSKWNDKLFPEPLSGYLRADINKVIKGALIYDVQRFSGISLRPKVREMLDAGHTNDCALLNRLLLEDALPTEIVHLPRKMSHELYSATVHHTNYVAVLVKHGADVKAAKWMLNDQGELKAASLLRKISDGMFSNELVGTWIVDSATSNSSIKGFIELAADGTAKANAVLVKDTKTCDISFEATWYVTDGILVETATKSNDERIKVGRITRDTIVKVDDREFTYETERGVLETRQRKLEK